jgi:hypothetical protein
VIIFLAVDRLFGRLIDNTSIAKRISQMARFDLQKITDRLASIVAKRSSASASELEHAAMEEPYHFVQV